MTDDESFWRELLALNVTNITREPGFDVEGTLPTEIGLLTTLRILDLTVVQGPSSEVRGRSLLTGGTGLSGTLPTELGLLRSLSVVRFGPMDTMQLCQLKWADRHASARDRSRTSGTHRAGLALHRLLSRPIAVPGFDRMKRCRRDVTTRVCLPRFPARILPCVCRSTELTNVRLCTPCEDTPLGLPPSV